MKNKSKLAKLKKERKEIVPQVPKNWLYLHTANLELTALKEALGDCYSVEYWEEAGVLEIELETEKTASVDFETVDMKRADEATAEYLQQHEIQTVFLVSISPEAYEASKEVMEKVTASCGGYFCGDTADFMPIIKGV